MKRPLFPPMMQLISCPGVGNLGRGRAVLPWEALQQAGLPSALSTLAEDAVKVRAALMRQEEVQVPGFIFHHTLLTDC
jgi:hypothetical protein